VRRARCMVAVYSDGFKKVAKDTYPIMSTTGLVPTSPPAAGSSGREAVGRKRRLAPLSVESHMAVLILLLAIPLTP